MGKGGYSETVLSFGKFKGYQIGSISNSYLGRLLRQDWFEQYAEFEGVQDEVAWRKDNSVFVEE